MPAAITHRVGLGRNLTPSEVDANFDNLVAEDAAVRAVAVAKQDALIAGPNITIGPDGRTISATGTGGATPIVNDLVTGGISSALSAEQGKNLKVSADALAGTVSGKQNTLSAPGDVPGLTAALAGKQATLAGTADVPGLTAALAGKAPNILTGLSTADASDVVGTDTPVTAFGKLQAKFLAIAATVRGTVLTGLSTGSTADVTSSDTILVAIGKLAAKIAAGVVGTFAGLSDKATADLPNVNTPLQTALSLKANAAAPSFTGTETHVGADLETPSAMAALVIDITKRRNTKTVAAASTFTFSAAAADGAQFGLELNVTTAAVMTFPSHVSGSTQGSARTQVYFPIGLWKIFFTSDGSVVRMYGDPGMSNNFAGSTAPTTTDDSTKGYGPGSMWFNGTTAVYFCKSATAAAAVWVQGGAGTPDTTAPTLVLAQVANATPGRIDLTWSEPMDAAMSAVGAFAVNSGHALTAHTYVDSTHSYLTTSSNFTNGEAARTLAYTQPGTNNMKDAAGNLLANFSGTAISNLVGAADTTPPTLVSATVQNSTPSQIDLVWSEPMNATMSAAAAFAVSAGHALTAHTYVDSTHSYLTTSTAFTNGETARTLAYTQPGSNKMQDTSANLLANIASASIVNNVGIAGLIDDFNRANSTTSPGSSSVGAIAWTVSGASVWGINANQAYLVTNAGVGDTMVLDTGFSTGTFSVDVLVGASQFLEFMFAYQDASNYQSLMFDADGAGYSVLALVNCVGGTRGSPINVVGSPSYTYNVMNTFSVVRNGTSTIVVKINGTTVYSAATGILTTATKVGFRAAAATTSVVRIDNLARV
jgi:hypothetical protein